MALFKRKAKSNTNEPVAGEKQGQMQVLKDAFRLTRKHQPIAFLWMALAFVLVLCAGIIVGIIGVSEPIAKRTAPVLSSLISKLRLIVASGKIPITSPARR